MNTEPRRYLHRPYDPVQYANLLPRTVKHFTAFAFQEKSSELIKEFSSERAVWKNNLSQLETEKDEIIGNCLLLASFLTYCGCLSWSYRNELLFNNWAVDLRRSGIPISSTFSLFNKEITAGRFVTSTFAFIHFQ